MGVRDIHNLTHGGDRIEYETSRMLTEQLSTESFLLMSFAFNKTGEVIID